MDDWTFLDGLNMSELASLASSQDVNAHRGLPREQLIDIIKGGASNLSERQIDIWRKSIFVFVDTHWRQVSSLLSCPMKTRQPHACFQCTDVQVAECVVSNHALLVRARDLVRKKEGQT